MGIKSEIILDNPHNTYYAGQTINGKIDFTFNSPKKVEGIIFKAKGKACTSWHEKEGKNRVEYSDDETYFEIKYNLLGSKIDEILLPAGQHSYSFTCDLPHTLPPSFAEKYGSIEYMVKVTIERPWKFDHVVKSAFTVISNLDLNLDPIFKNPVVVREEKHFWSLSEIKPLAVTVSLPFPGYVSGQMISFTIEVDNRSDVTVDQVQISFVKIVTYFSDNRTESKVDKTYVVSKIIAMAPIDQGQSKSASEEIQIPALPPSNLKNCTIIDLDYELKVKCAVSGLHNNHKIRIPIIIGTIPLLTMQPSIKPNNVSDVAAMIGWNISAEGSTNYNELPPPTYEECQFGTSSSITGGTDNRATLFSNAQHFTPRYPVCSFASAPPIEKMD